MSDEQLFDGMATYVACNYGADVYDELNAVMCAHGLRECGDPAPVSCETCGNDVREGSETCDGLDWAYAECTDVAGYVGGDLHCDAATCQLDFSLCLDPGGEGLDSTAGTGHDPGAVTTAPAEGETEDGPAPRSGDDGCKCASSPLHRGEMWLLAFLACVAARRRRSFR